MHPIKKYHYLGLSVILLISIFTYFSDENNITYDMTGIIHGVKASSNGYVFSIDTVDGDVRCFCKECPNDLGYYAVRGKYSNDGNIFFIERMHNMEKNDENNNVNQDLHACT